MQVGLSKNRNSQRKSVWINAAVRTTATVDCAVYNTDRQASVNHDYHRQHGRP